MYAPVPCEEAQPCALHTWTIQRRQQPSHGSRAASCPLRLDWASLGTAPPLGRCGWRSLGPAGFLVSSYGGLGGVGWGGGAVGPAELLVFRGAGPAWSLPGGVSAPGLWA